MATPRLSKAVREANRVARAMATRKARVQSVQRAVGRFRPRKSERQSFVFVSKEGRRLDKYSKRQGALVYVTRYGNKRIVRPQPRAPLKLRKRYDFVLGSIRLTPSQSKAASRFQRSVGMTQPKGIPYHGKSDFWRTGSKHIVRALRAKYKSNNRRPVTVHLQFTIKYPSGKTEQREVRFALSQAQITILLGKTKVKHPSEYVNGTIRSIVWQWISTDLAISGLVTSGSRNHVRRLSINQSPKTGKPKSRNLRTRHGFWRKEKFEVVQVVNWSYELETPG